jgi:hypothetical protein
MTTASSPVLVGPQGVHANPLGTVTADYVAIRDLHQRSQTIVALACISEITTVEAVRMHLMVFSSASFIIAAAAQCSSDGGGAAAPCALIGIVFTLAYLCPDGHLSSYPLSRKLLGPLSAHWAKLQS